MSSKTNQSNKNLNKKISSNKYFRSHIDMNQLASQFDDYEGFGEYGKNTNN